MFVFGVLSQPLCGDFKTCAACTGQRGCLFFDCGGDTTACEWCLEMLPSPGCSALCVKFNGRPTITNCSAIGQTTAKPPPAATKAPTPKPPTMVTATKSTMTINQPTPAPPTTMITRDTTLVGSSTTERPTGGGNCNQYTNCEKCNIEGSRSRPTQ